MTREELFENIMRKRSFLCVGLDTDVNKIPEFLFDREGDLDPIFEFNKSIIDATAEYCVAYKPNLAFYESLGLQGWDVLERTVDYIREKYPDQFLIADAKRGDIGNTSTMYARTFFGALDFDSVTVAPYMGEDSVSPFLTYENKWVTLLALTSNKGAFDFQFMEDKETGDRLFEKVLKTSLKWGNEDNMMYVVGATKAEMLADIRKIIPNHFLLVPGIGAQGGSLADVVKHGMNKQCGLLVNSSRAILYASNGEDYAQAAAAEAKKVQQQMSEFLKSLE
ncbi:MAG: orotidine-5'-phosphate decarboxylase [Paludibacteraceae bacterium]|nr:orotidine-5'-phosphate decarboxylase [Paludibacteraceae bacterium]MBO7608196.1 orotidine-5'-phosphate decarboxylase [Paludibacteraceae bacterium]MBP5480765.1 orotidine-5'-phosphate decarboxylase [Paludibacteraceae bacterium]MCR5497886.1 orotidine-5'-phosphate decarboxylase [Paludibacteraceae bacterium]